MEILMSALIVLVWLSLSLQVSGAKHAIMYRLNLRSYIIMATLADIQAKVAAETTVEQSAIALLQGLSQQLKDALSNGADPAVLQSIADQLDTNNAALAAAVTANTPAAPAPAA